MNLVCLVLRRIPVSSAAVELNVKLSVTEMYYILVNIFMGVYLGYSLFYFVLFICLVIQCKWTQIFSVSQCTEFVLEVIEPA